jgi:hypothetical protein
LPRSDPAPTSPTHSFFKMVKSSESSKIGGVDARFAQSTQSNTKRRVKKATPSEATPKPPVYFLRRLGELGPDELALVRSFVNSLASNGCGGSRDGRNFRVHYCGD